MQKSFFLMTFIMLTNYYSPSPILFEAFFLVCTNVQNSEMV